MTARVQLLIYQRVSWLARFDGWRSMTKLLSYTGETGGLVISKMIDGWFPLTESDTRNMDRDG